MCPGGLGFIVRGACPINLCPGGLGFIVRGACPMNLCPGGLGFIVRGACANNYVSRGVRVHCPGVGGGGGYLCPEGLRSIVRGYVPINFCPEGLGSIAQGLLIRVDVSGNVSWGGGLTALSRGCAWKNNVLGYISYISVLRRGVRLINGIAHGLSLPFQSNIYGKPHHHHVSDVTQH